MLEKLVTALWAATFVVLFYVLAYFVLVRPGPTIEVGGWWAAWPDYPAVPEVAEICFRPLHQWDRDFLRPSKWEGRRTAAEQMERARAAADAARKAAMNYLKQP